jgi:hypothetical protein
MLRRLPVLRLSKRMYHHNECNLIHSYVELGSYGQADSRLSILKNESMRVNRKNVQRLIDFVSDIKSARGRYCLVFGTIGSITVTDCFPAGFIFLAGAFSCWMDYVELNGIVQKLKNVRDDN